MVVTRHGCPESDSPTLDSRIPVENHSRTVRGLRPTIAAITGAESEIGVRMFFLRIASQASGLVNSVHWTDVSGGRVIATVADVPTMKGWCQVRNRIVDWLPRANGSDGAFLMADRVTTKAVSGETTTAAVLSRNLKWELKQARVKANGNAVIKAMRDKGIEGGSPDSVTAHIRASQGFETKNPADTILQAYADLFGYQDIYSILKSDHIRVRKNAITKKATDLTGHVTFAKKASLGDAHASLDRLWGTPHQSLAAYLLKYLESD